MKKNFISAVFFGLFIINQATFAHDGHGSHSNASKTMASILVHINHYPSDQEKNKLSNIIDQSDSPHEIAIATAMKNLRHSATDNDKAKLKKIIDDPKADTTLKDIANIIYHLNHKPSSADKKILNGIID